MKYLTKPMKHMIPFNDFFFINNDLFKFNHVQCSQKKKVILDAVSFQRSSVQYKMVPWVPPILHYDEGSRNKCKKEKRSSCKISKIHKGQEENEKRNKKHLDVYLRTFHMRSLWIYNLMIAYMRCQCRMYWLWRRRQHWIICYRHEKSFHDIFFKLFEPIWPLWNGCGSSRQYLEWNESCEP